MTEPQVWLHDRLVPAADARVSVYDRGFRTGEGVFETLRTYGVQAFRLGPHLDRAEAGAAVLGFELPPRDLLVGALTATAEANHDGRDLGLRLTATPGEVDPRSAFPGEGTGEPTLVVTASPLDIPPSAYQHGVSAAVVPWSREIPHVKAVSYLAATLARRQAREQGADEALLTDARGWVLEGSYSNVFAVVGGRVVTPPVDAGILPGVTRAVTIQVATAQGLTVDESPISVSELVAADEAFLTSSTRELVPLVRVSGERIGSGGPGPITAALHEGYRAEVRREIAG